MKYLTPILLTALTCSLGTSCSYIEKLCWWQKSPKLEEKKEQEAPPQYLGTVHQIYPKEKFVLLRIIGPMPKAGDTLISHPSDGSNTRMGNLVVSEDSAPLKGLLVADVRSGSVASGDRIFLYRNISATEKEKKIDGRTPVTKPGEGEELPQLRERVSGPGVVQQEPGKKPAPVRPEPSVTKEESFVEQKPAPAPIFETPPAPSGSADKVPSHINNLPEDIDQWN